MFASRLFCPRADIALGRLCLIQRRLHRRGRPPELPRHQIELRVGLTFAAIGLDRVSRIDDDIVLDEQRIAARMTVILKVHASEPGPSLHGIDPAQAGNLETVVESAIGQCRKQIFGGQRNVGRRRARGCGFARPRQLAASRHYDERERQRGVANRAPQSRSCIDNPMPRPQSRHQIRACGDAPGRLKTATPVF